MIFSQHDFAVPVFSPSDVLVFVRTDLQERRYRRKPKPGARGSSGSGAAKKEEAEESDSESDAEAADADDPSSSHADQIIKEDKQAKLRTLAVAACLSLHGFD